MEALSRCVLDVSPLDWRVPSGISALVDQLDAGNGSLERGMRPISFLPSRRERQEALPDLTRLPYADRLEMLLPGSLWACRKFLGIEGRFVATTHFIPRWRGGVTYLLYDLLKVKMAREMHADRSRHLELLKANVEKADQIVTISEASASDIEEVLSPSVPIAVWYPGVDTELFSPGPAVRAHGDGHARLEGNRPFLYTCGVVQARKRIDWCFRVVQEIGSTFRLVVSGAFDDRARREWDRLRGVYPDVDAVHLGYQEREGQVALYRECSAFLFPSRYEGFGFPPAEAMACGVPVVVSAASSLPEVVGDPEQMFRPESFGDFLACVRRWVSADEEARAEVGRRNRARVEEMFGVERSWRRFMSVLEGE